jgi:1-acyl-sn-glycerol-3-phosphate acyltransferase
VPKTSSGKIRRQAARAVFESGAVGAAAVRRQVLRLAFSAMVPLIRRAARRTLDFLFAIYVSAVGIAIAVVGWLATAVLPLETWRWRSLRPLIRIYCWAAGIRLSRTNISRIPRGRAFIVAANHSSYLDGPMLTWALPGRFTYVAKAELLDHWVSRIFLKRLGTAFVTRFDAQRSVADTDRIAAVVRQGRGLVTFPEGTLSRMAGLLPFQLGAFLMAVRTGAPIVPVVIRGTRHVMRDGTWIPRPGPVSIDVLEPIESRPAAELADDEEWRAAVALRDRTRAAILARCGEPDLVHERPLDVLAAEARGPKIMQGV